MLEALTTNCQQSKITDKLMMAEALQECLLIFLLRLSPRALPFCVSWLHRSPLARVHCHPTNLEEK